MLPGRLTWMTTSLQKAGGEIIQIGVTGEIKPGKAHGMIGKTGEPKPGKAVTNQSGVRTGMPQEATALPQGGIKKGPWKGKACLCQIT